jgi:hypothetical protein
MPGPSPLKRRGTSKDGKRKTDKAKGIELPPTQLRNPTSPPLPKQEHFLSSNRSICHHGDIRAGDALVYGTQDFRTNEKISRSKRVFHLTFLVSCDQLQPSALVTEKEQLLRGVT